MIILSYKVNILPLVDGAVRLLSLHILRAALREAVGGFL
jgi:hypothetical protein